MRRILLALAVLLVAAVAAAAWIVPSRINWQERRAEVEDAASAVLDRRVRIEGKFAFRLLPNTRVSAINLVVEDSGDGFSARAQEVRLVLKFWPLMLGRVVATEVVLVSPRITLSGLSPPIMPAQLAPPWIAQARVRIEDGTLQMGAMAVRGIDARLSGEGPGGPFALEGEATALGRRLRIAAALGRAGFDGTAPVEASLVTTAAPATELRAIGLLALPTLTFAGRVTATTADLSTLMPAPPIAARAEATLTATPDGLAADEVSLDLAGVTGAGAFSAALAPARIDLALAFPRLDVDAWRAPLLALVGAGGVPISLELTAEAATFRGATMRGVQLAGRLANGQAAIDRFTALLPGNTQLTLSGAASRADGAPRFEGMAQIDTNDSRGTLAWLGVPTDWVAQPNLRQARGSAQVTLAAGLLQIGALDGTLDAVRLGGGMVVQTAGARPAFGIGLTLERFEPEAWLTEAARAPDALAASLRGFDANVRLETPLLVLRGPGGREISARDASLDATLEAGRLVVRRLASGDTLGARVTSAFTLAMGPPVRIQDFRLEIDSSDTAGLAVLVPDGIARRLFQGPGLLRLAGQAAEQALAIELEAELGGARVEARGHLDVAQPRFTGSTTLRHPGARRWLRQLGWGELAGWIGDGSLSVRAPLDAQPTRLALGGFELVAGAVRAEGELALALPPAAPPALSGRVALETIAIPLPAADSSIVLGFDLFAGWSAEVALRARRLLLGPLVLDQPEAKLAVADGTARLQDVSAMLAGGKLEGRVELSLAAAQPVLSGAVDIAGATITGPISGAALDVAAGRLDLAGTWSARGFAPAALVATLSGEGEVQLHQGVLAGFDLAAVTGALQGTTRATDALARLRAALSGGATAFERLEGRFRLEGGALGFEGATLAAEPGTALLSGTLDLGARAIDVRAMLEPAGAEALPPIGMRLTGPAGAPRRSVDTAEAARWLSARPQP